MHVIKWHIPTKEIMLVGILASCSASSAASWRCLWRFWIVIKGKSLDLYLQSWMTGNDQWMVVHTHICMRVCWNILSTASWKGLKEPLFVDSYKVFYHTKTINMLQNPIKRNHVGWLSGFLKGLVEILDCHQREEFRFLYGGLGNWKWSTDAGPHTCLHENVLE